MKYLISLFLLLPCAAHAQQGIQNVHEVATSTRTLTQTISICFNTNPVNVTAATSSGTIAGAFAIEVYNLASSTATLNCGQDLMLSTQPSSAWYGREVPAGVGLYYAVPPATRKTYCSTQNPGGCNRVTVTQYY